MENKKRGTTRPSDSSLATDPTSAGSGKQTRGEKTRAKIVEVALKFFARKGYNQTSVQEIADACKITQPAIFIHFKTKLDLLHAVRKFVSRSNHDFVDARASLQDNAFEALFNHCFGNLEWGIQHPDEAQIILLTYYYSFFEPHFIEIFPSVIALGTERILKYVAAGVREGLFHPDQPQAECATMIHEYLVGCFTRNLPARQTKNMTSIEEKRLKHFLKMVLGTD